MTNANMAILSRIAYLDMPFDLKKKMPNVTLYELITHLNFSGMENGEKYKDAFRIIINNNDLRTLKITGYTNQNGNGSGLVAYSFDDRGNAVFAFRGTDGISPEDWYDNISGLSGTTRQQKEALDFVKMMLQLYDHNNVYVTGHSLGGALAQYVAIKLDAVTQCIVFNSRGVSGDLKAYAESTGRDGKITSYYNRGDIVKLLNKAGLHNIGEVELSNRGGMFDRHNVNHFIHEFEQQGGYASGRYYHGGTNNGIIGNFLGKMFGQDIIIDEEAFMQASTDLEALNGRLAALRADIENMLTQLEKGFDTPAGAKFNNSCRNILIKPLEDQKLVLDHVSDNLKTAKTQYQSVFDAYRDLNNSISSYAG